MAHVILIHGSWHAAWCWYKIKPRLEALGHIVYVPDLPGHGQNPRKLPALVGLSTMVKTITDVLDASPEPCTIVVHSRNGIVASQAAELRPDKVRRLVYLASFMLRNGERAVDCFYEDDDSLLKGSGLKLDRFALTDMIQSHLYRSALYADCSNEDVTLASSLLMPEPSRPALARLHLSEKNYGAIDRYYIELTEDRAVSLAQQRRFIKRSPVLKVFSIQASHSAYFSKPEELTTHILESMK